ncbi:MAG: histidine kinase [Rhodoferax sp.]|uniref:sensor histidine kinase n=1 Tax=Rhodoferax sp. TaxID=50421 RepID=UPI00262C4FC3|nr:histidine kinase [Rhodoferax sp.]MDD5332194.1 histidine kinase [Rhodoferax sp.]
MNIPRMRTHAVDALRDEFMWRGHWLVMLAGVLAFAATQPAAHTHPAWGLALGLWLGYCLAYALTTGFVQLFKPQRWLLALSLLTLCVAVGAATGWWLELSLRSDILTVSAQHAHAGLHLTFCAVLLVTPVAQAAMRQRAMQKVEAERARVQAELQMLQAQIEPHFLFNTLATLRSLVRQQSVDALPLLDRISGFMEAVLPQVRQTQSTLGRELHIVEQYLGILSMRLGSRLSYRIEVDEALHDLPLPPLLLQPLVENAIVHGIEPCEAGGNITLQARSQGERLSLIVCNTGEPLHSAPAEKGHGVALQNLRDRLRLLYGDQASFSLHAGVHCTEAVLLLPLPLESKPA